jgi:hypothetical protein
MSGFNSPLAESLHTLMMEGATTEALGSVSENGVHYDYFRNLKGRHYVLMNDDFGNWLADEFATEAEMDNHISYITDLLSPVTWAWEEYPGEDEDEKPFGMHSAIVYAVEDGDKEPVAYCHAMHAQTIVDALTAAKSRK